MAKPTRNARLRVELCKGCGKPVVFAKTEDGSTVILDPRAPIYRATGHREEGGQLVVTGVQLEDAEIAGRSFVSHFATCPDANDFSRSKRKAT